MMRRKERLNDHHQTARGDLDLRRRLTVTSPLARERPGSNKILSVVLYPSEQMERSAEWALQPVTDEVAVGATPSPRHPSS